MQPKWLVLLILCLILAACSSTQKSPDAETLAETSTSLLDPFSLLKHPPKAIPDVPLPQGIFELSSVQKQDFLRYYQAPENQHVRAHKRLYQYLENSIWGFTFLGDTYDAKTAMQLQAGNCLSLAILTTALADIAGVEVEYQQVNSAPVYLKRNNILSMSSHVRTHVFDPDFEVPKNKLVLGKPKIIIDYFPTSGNISGSKVSRQQFVAKYYQNLAATALTEGDLSLAYALLMQAEKVSANNPETLNSLAVLYNRMGERNAAKQLYSYILEYTPGSIHAVSNYAQMLQSEGDHKGADALFSSIGSVFDDNPYRWLDIAERQLKKGHQAVAYKYFKRAIDLAPYLHESYFGLARLYYAKGNQKKAKRALEKATEYAYVPEQKKLYQAKLVNLITKE